MRALLVEFDSQPALRAALSHLALPGITIIDTYSPMPPDEEPTRSPLPLCMLVTGLLGFTGFFALMAYANVHAYPLNYGGRPDFAWPTYVPIAFELGVLCAMVTGFVGYFVVCRMPRLHDPVDECSAFPRASRDGWFVALTASDPERLAAARRSLESLAPTSAEEYET